MAQTDPRVDAYIGRAAGFAQPVLAHLRAAVHAACPQADETIKWGMPFFMYRGKMLAFMAAFTAHCGFGFPRGREVVQTGKESDAMGQFGRLVSVGDLPAKRELAALIRKAAALIDAAAPLPKVPQAPRVKPVGAKKAAPRERQTKP